ncbi:hypothetical protein ITG10_08870 [Vibrio sp. ED004]|uniref:hypothetical protein n=1 Tax=Vibrio sp. ED004 TaxID=2785124 RepID=UPI00205D5FD5|nr:hypothetical protein [Vibrio sp. ED004]UPR55347.1 hypothetical protein ITG10_08870 [Vibrio sp. ED004]
MYETAILVVLYNKEITISKTLTSLLSTNMKYNNTKLVIWNNGSDYLSNRTIDAFRVKGFDTEIKETIYNESLAVIYNNFIDDFPSKKYILLDDDSSLNEKYLGASLLCDDNQIAMPIIYSRGKVRAPTIDGMPYNKDTVIHESSNIMTIGSGLVIGNEVINRLKIDYLKAFDERFFLYCVDTSFCLRISSVGLIGNIKVIDGFQHSLSRLEKESSELNKFRRKERSYGIGLQQRYYFPIFQSSVYIAKVIVVTIKSMLTKQERVVNIRHLIGAYLLGKHYRNCNS